MTKVKKAIAIVASIILAAFAFILGKRKLSKKKEKPEAPPKNEVADVALDGIQETFKQESDRIKTATTGDSPADDLADLGNARRR
tara:strand:+ start:1023 stop:1277 length:255 start_codon:yes stop_codon:yes gene_type:complete